MRAVPIAPLLRLPVLAACVAALAAGAAGQAARPIKPPPRPVQRGDLNLPRLPQAGSLVRAAEARATYAVSGAGLTVAVIDTGIRASHQDFAGRVVAQVNYTADNGADPGNAADGDGHGSHVSGIVAANGVHVGVAPGASIAALKVLDNTGNGTFASVVAALDWVIANRAALGISAVNLSLGDGGNYTSFSNDTLGNRLQTLRNLGVAVCAAAGNDYFGWGSAQGMGYPAVFASTVSVGAVYDADVGRQVYSDGGIANTTGAERLCPFSQRLHPAVQAANRTDVVAPGAILTATGITSNSASASGQGTSQATPMTAGVVLLLQEYYLRQTGSLPTVAQLEGWLRAGAAPVNDGDDEDDNVANTGLDFPRLDAVGAFAALEQELAAFRISGRVTLNGVGLEGVTLAAGNRSAATDAGGDYLFTGLPAGAYTLTPSLAGYEFEPVSRQVTVGPSATGVDFVAVPAAFTISGRVTLNGTGAAGTTVSAGTRSTVTGSDGTYALTDLPAGAYVVAASRGGYSFTPTSQNVTVGPSRTNVDFAGVSAGSTTFAIRGTVRANGLPLSGVSIAAGGKAALTIADGTYVVTGLSAGSYAVVPTRTGYTFDPVQTVVAVGPDASGVDFTGTGSETFSAAGVVTVDGAALPGVEVTSGNFTAVTGADGAFALQGLPTGRYVLTPRLAGFTFSPTTRTVNVGPDRTGVDFAATRLLTLSGTVFAGGVGLPGVSVAAGGKTAVTNALGHYTLTDLSPGAYTVTPARQGYRFTPPSRSVNLAGADAVAVDFEAIAVPILASITFAAAEVRAGKKVGGTVRFTLPVTARTSVALTQAPSGNLKLPASVVVKKGKTTATFTARALRPPASVSVQVSGAADGVSRSANLRVSP